MASYSKVPFLERFDREIIVGDGATGSLFYSRGLSPSDCFEHLNLTAPAMVRQIHADYLASGARFLETNSFLGNARQLSRHGLAKQVKDINRAAAKLAREVSRGEAYIAGSVGPIGKAKMGQEAEPLTVEDREKIYAEQIEALVEGGVDLLILETFLTVEDLLAAYRAARKLCKLPVIAQMAFIRNNVTYGGVSVETFARAMTEVGADVIGANCGHGTIGAISVCRELASLGVTRFSAFPNAGFPDYVEGRYLYRTEPEYFARRAMEAVDVGARLVGGCCGTGPSEIRVLAKQLSGRTPSTISIPRRGSPIGRPPSKRPSAALIQPFAPVPKEHFLSRWPERKIITVELDPPRGGDFRKVIEGAKLCLEAGADAISIADNPLAIVRMSNIVLGYLVQSEVGIPVIIHIAGRDRNLLGIRSDLMGAAVLGLNTLLPLTGDPSSIGDCAGATSVYDLNSFGLVSLIASMNKGDAPGAPPGGFKIGVAYNPNVRNLSVEAGRLRKKALLGAQFVQTQAVFDPETARKSHEAVKDLNLPIFFGILPFLNFKNAEFIGHEIPGIVVPEPLIERMREAKAPGEEGLKIAEELIEGTFDFAGGYYLLPPFNRAALAVHLIRKIRKLERV